MKRVVVICAMLALIFLACCIALNFSVRHMERGVRAEAKASDTPSDISLLLETSKSQSLIGKIVFLHEVQIEPGPSKNLFFASDQQNNKIVVSSDAAAMHAGSGNLANVMGVITALPLLATMEREWKLSKPVAVGLRKETVYIRADRIWPAHSSPR